MKNTKDGEGEQPSRQETFKEVKNVKYSSFPKSIESTASLFYRLTRKSLI